MSSDKAKPYRKRNIFIPANWIDNAGDDFTVKTEPDQLEYVPVALWDELVEALRAAESIITRDGYLPDTYIRQGIAAVLAKVDAEKGTQS